MVFLGVGIAVWMGMRILLILLAVPGLAHAAGLYMPKNQVSPLVPPAFISPPNPAGGYPLNGQLGVNTQFGIPAYLAFYNRGIPGFNGKPATAFNILPYGQQLQNQTPKPASAAGAGASPIASLLKALGGGGGPGSNNSNGGNYNGGNYGSGNNGSGNFSGTPVNSGHDGLCYQAGLFQTTPKDELGGRSPCQVISDTIRDSCTGPQADSLASGNLEGMEEFCPGWDRLKVNEDTRNRVLTALVAATVRTESSWRNDTAGDGGTSKGLLQLTVASDQSKGCSCSQLTNEFNMGQNLRCGTHMIISYMAQDRTVGRGGQGTARGIARSFGPYRDGRRERPDIIRRVSGYCRMLLNEAPRETAPDAVPMS